MIRASIAPSRRPGFGDLRQDLVVVTVPSKLQQVIGAYDELVRNAALRKEYVRKAQIYMQSKGLYTKRIDGVWGSGSEGGFISLVPSAERSLTQFSDLEKIVRESNGQTEMPAWIAAGISRDVWLRTAGGVTPEIDPRTVPRDSTADVPETPSTEAHEQSTTDYVQDVSSVVGDDDEGVTEVADGVVGPGASAPLPDVQLTVGTTISAKKVFPLVATVLMGLGVAAIAGAVIWHTTRKGRR